MAFENEQREAMRLLTALENGGAPVSETAQLIADADPALVHLVFAWLRARYHGEHPAAEGVLGRLLEVSSGYDSVRKQLREGKADPIVGWFEEEYEYRDLRAEEFVGLVVEKLEG